MRFTWALAPMLFCNFVYAAGVVEIYPGTLTISPGVTQQYSIYNTTSGIGVTWSVNGIPGGNDTYGTISQTGLYKAPAAVPATNVVTVRATSAPSGISGPSTVKIVQPIPTIWSTYPVSLPSAGSNQMFSLNGVNFLPASIVQLNGMTIASTYVNGTTMKATGNFPAAGTYAVTVTNPGNGASTSKPVKITVGSAPPPPPPPPAVITVTVNPSNTSVALSATAQFSATVTGTANTTVTWSATAGSINAAGLFTAPASMPAGQVVTINAVSAADATRSAQATVLLTSYSSGGGNGGDLHAGRFLEQAAFGPSPADLAFIHQNASANQDGIDTWLANQFAMAPSTLSLPAGYGGVQSDTLHRMAAAPDQLRQKMAWAIGQFIVISMNKNIYPDEYVPYQQILLNDAFGNFRTLLYDITVSPQMGKYLDLANSNKAGVGGGANENYARELMQLFTIGLNKLNLDGSQQLVNGAPVPTYLQPDVVHVAQALTGWTYPTTPGSQAKANNWEYFTPPVMETRQANHDVSAKSFLGCSLPAGQTVIQDTNGVLDCVFNHPNTGPFIATRLIRNLVTSNPTPGYIQRVATVFNDNGKGVRGDLQAVLTAILKDPEARQDTVTFDAGGNPYYLLNGSAVSYTPGRLKDPMYFIVAFVRALNGTIPAATVIPYEFVAMGETVNQPPSVFGYWSPLYHLPINPLLLGPEFQIYTPTESVEEANMLQAIITMPNSDPSIDLSPFNAAAANTATLLDLADQKFFYGRMPAQVRTALGVAIDANTDNPSRVLTAVYLAVLCGQYQTQY